MPFPSLFLPLVKCFKTAIKVSYPSNKVVSLEFRNAYKERNLKQNGLQNGLTTGKKGQDYSTNPWYQFSVRS